VVKWEKTLVNIPRILKIVFKKVLNLLLRIENKWLN